MSDGNDPENQDPAP